MIKRVNTNYYFGLDFLRGVAIVLMLITHGFRLFVKSSSDYQAGEGFAERLLNLFAVIEPYTSSLFLFLAGIGLTISFNQNKGSNKTWLSRHSKKAAQLYLIGMVLFFIEKGYQSPDFWVSPSILSTIAISLVFTGICLMVPYGVLLGLGVTGVITAYFEGTGIAGINAGPGGVFPLIMFTLWGSLLWNLLEKKKYLPIAFILLLSLGAYATDYAWVQHYNSTYHEWLTGTSGLDYLKSAGEYNVTKLESYWNHSFTAMMRLVVLLFGSLFICLHKQDKLSNKKINHFLTLLGRHALGCYILHLSIIALCDVLRLYPPTAIMDWLYIGFLIAVCGVYSAYKERK